MKDLNAKTLNAINQTIEKFKRLKTERAVNEPCVFCELTNDLCGEVDCLDCPGDKLRDCECYLCPLAIRIEQKKGISRREKGDDAPCMIIQYNKVGKPPELMLSNDNYSAWFYNTKIKHKWINGFIKFLEKWKEEESK